MNIIKRELKGNAKSFLIWSVCIAAIIYMMMSEFSAYYNNPEMTEILDAIPEGIMKAFSLYGTNLMTLTGFLSFASIYYYILLSVYAALLGSSIIAKEERDKTAEFLMSMPVSRTKVIVMKLISAVILCLALNLITASVTLATAMPYDRPDSFYRFLFLMMLALFILQMIFLSIGMLLSAIVKRYKRSGSYSMGVLFSLYILSIILSLSDKIDFLKYATPFQYFEATAIVRDSALDMTYVMISIGIILAALIGTFVFYPRRDLSI